MRDKGSEEEDFRGSEFVGYAPSPTLLPEPESSRGFRRDELGWLAGLLTGALLLTLDFFIGLVTLPSIQPELGSSYPELQLMVAAYAAAVASGLIAGGRLGDLYGPKRVYLLGLLITATSALFAAISDSVAWMIFARALQGFAVALIQPQIISLIGTRFSGHQRRKAFAAYSLCQAIGAVAGQLLAGALINTNLFELGWRACYLVMIPVALVSAVITAKYLPERLYQKSEQVDWMGMIICATTLTLFSWTMTVGRESLSTKTFFLLLFFSLLAMMFFIWQQFRADSRKKVSMLPIPLLKGTRTQLGLVCVFLFYLGIMSFYWLISMRTQTEMKMSAWEAGLVFSSFGISFMVSTFLSPQVGRLLTKWTIPSGSLLIATGHSFNAISSWIYGSPQLLVVALAITGTGVGLVMAPLFATVTDSAKDGDAGALAGVVGTVQAAANSIGASVIPMVYLASGSQSSDSLPGGFTTSLLLLATIALLLATLTQLATDTRAPKLKTG